VGFSSCSRFVVPLTPKKRIEIVFAKTTDRRRHLALERLSPHLAIDEDLQTHTCLQGDGIIDGAIFNLFELFTTKAVAPRPTSKIGTRR